MAWDCDVALACSSAFTFARGGSPEESGREWLDGAMTGYGEFFWFLRFWSWRWAAVWKDGELTLHLADGCRSGVP